MTATALELVITQLATVEAAIAGVAVAHDKTPESLGSLPAFINYPSSGEALHEAGTSRELHTIIAEVFIGRGDQKVAESTARPFINLFMDAIWADDTLASTCATVRGIRYRYGALPWPGVEGGYVGVRFEVDIKLQRVL